MIKSLLNTCLVLIFVTTVHAQKTPDVLKKSSLKGDWFKTDGSNDWKISFLDSAVIYDGQVWNYTVKPVMKNEKMAIDINSGKKKKTIYAMPDGKGNYLFGEQEKQVERYSQTDTHKSGFKDNSDQPFKLPILKQDSTTYSGYLKGYSTKSNFKTGRIQVTDVITGHTQSYLIDVKPDGTFFVKFPLNYPHELYVNFPGYDSMVFFEPGKKLFQLIHLADKGKVSIFMGSTARLNKELPGLKSVSSINYNLMYQEVTAFTPEQYKKYLSDKEASILKEIMAYEAKHNVSKKTAQLILFDVMYHIALLKEAYRQRVPDVKPSVLDSAYFSYISMLPAENQLSLISDMYRSFLNGIRSTEAVNGKSFVATTVPAEKTFEQFLLQEKLPGDEADLMKAYILINAQRGENYNKAVKNFQLKYTSQKLNYVLDFYSNKLNRISYELVERNRIKKMKSFFNLKTSFITDLFLSQQEYEVLEEAKQPFTDKYFLSLKTEITNPFFIRILKEENEKLRKEKPVAATLKNETTQSLPATITPVNKIDKSVDEDLFLAIVNRYKGKVILVDFWATWCSPCLAVIKNMVPLKDELAKEDIVFVYITNETSPVATYNNMIGGIKGEHFRLNNDEWNVLSEKFNINGIPHQVLVDKKGDIINPSFRHADNVSLKAILLEQTIK